MDHFGIFSELLATQNVNVARFARNAECDFFCDFQTLCKGDVDLVSLLVENMSPEEISHAGFGGTTPLHLAVFSGHLPVVSVLASHGANLMVINLNC